MLSCINLSRSIKYIGCNEETVTLPSFFVLIVFFYLNKKASYQAEIQTENSEKLFNL